VARDRADHALRMAVIADGAARAQHDLAELRIRDIRTPEYRFDQFIAMHRALAMPDQVFEALETASRQLDGPTAAREFACLRHETELAELEYVVIHPARVAQ
jgi:hypothetical protein